LVVTVEDKSSAEFEIDDNLLDIVVFETDGETLTIHTTENYNSKHGLKVRLSTPELTGLDLSGAATAQIDGVAAEEFDLDLSGASSATVRGSATAFSASASGASKIRCYELETKETSASLSGASSAELHATESVAVKASGASSAKYKGNPEQVSRSISGASSIQPAESD
jgi:hypothetical protein